VSTPFTTPAGQSWQTLLSEITLAYSERRQAIGQSAYTPEAVRDVQSSAYWRTLQGWLESNCTSFIDHVNGPLTDAGDAFLYFTLATWRAAAGLNANGFRRSPLAGGTAYGQMQIGDAIGGWIFEDLQRGFGALRVLNGSLTWSGISSAGGDGYVPTPLYDWYAVKAVADADWHADAIPSNSNPQAWSFGYKGGAGALAIIRRVQSQPTCSGVSSRHGYPLGSIISVPYIVKLYVKGDGGYQPGFFHGYIVHVGGDYNNNGDGILESDSYSLRETSPELTSPEWKGTTIGNNAVANKPIWVAGGDDPFGDQSKGYICRGICLIEYHFTNA